MLLERRYKFSQRQPTGYTRLFSKKNMWIFLTQNPHVTTIIDWKKIIAAHKDISGHLEFS